MRKIMTLLLAAVLTGSAVAPMVGCAQRTAQQKKTKAFKRQSKGGRMPCPTHDC
ncbi:hypothetical protein H8B13_09375 [Hymenobacter sp. BT188]|uniref:hypothetical protein n=1 Tax=Hymenobacter sp. BT188 TaxID=2763504 RepID=UPI001650E932|nr:hypothetical protein [Hymenobacter sp. BT188]MBC6607028.1 hypothetical protein [Hymenobacter sp. BT188]